MFHPVGSHSANVYWRRRMVAAGFAVVLVVLAVLTWRTLAGGDGGGQAAAGVVPSTHSATSAPATTSATSAPARTRGSPTGSATTSPTRHATSSRARTGSTSAKSSTSAIEHPCSAVQLAVSAVTDRSQYAVGAQPVLSLQVIDTGSAPCVQDVGDAQIVLRVYNGAARVWSSHDCGVKAGTTERTLEPGEPARFSITWTGLTSQPKCAGTRQRVGAGVYTLYASLAGHEGVATQFTMS